MDNKTHYRKVFKSDHLGSADLEDMVESGQRLVFTISHVRQEYGVRVAGSKGDFNIAYFVEKIKPLVLNSTNSKTMKKLCGNSSFVEDWKNVPVELYIDSSVKMKGETVGGVRIKPDRPAMGKPVLTPELTNKWSQAINAYVRDGNLDVVLKRCIISKENQSLIIDAANKIINTEAVLEKASA